MGVPKARHRVLESIETQAGDRCVDIFERVDGTWGFEEYRRDVEDGRGWFPIGFHSERGFESVTAARAAAIATITWLAVTVGRDPGTPNSVCNLG